MVAFTFGLLFHFFVPCFFGNEIQYDYAELLRDVYRINWTEADKKQIHSFVIIQENLKQNFQLKAAKIFPINLASFMRILKSGYSLYTVLNQIND